MRRARNDLPSAGCIRILNAVKSGNKTSSDSFQKLARDVSGCKRCPRLRSYCHKVASEKRAAYASEKYWGRPVPNFGAWKAELLVIGLAPAAHGGNRTGRMFTGDRSGQWLYRALYRAGFANQATYERADDGLTLDNCAITAVAHCAPPDNKPTSEEIAACSSYLGRTIALYQPKVFLALGAIAWKAIILHHQDLGLWKGKAAPFAHRAEVGLTGGAVILASYHPSQQNTFTKRLTEPMFDEVFARARELIAKPSTD